jgi:3-methylcrotonyl-CoA carboxylase alpha subunit
VFASILIANRGEIAVRIIKTARRLGLRTIAVHSQADRDALHVRLADEAYDIGPAPAPQSYLDGARILEVGRRSGAECLHPGYGFLSERAEFAEACAAMGMVFIGPPAAAIRAMGLKDEAKRLMQKAGVPVVAGYHGSRQEPAFLREKAYEIGYPVAIKAVAGGGGKGLRRVDAHAEFEAALESAQREAIAAFGNGQVLIEKYIAAPRHIEMQIFADRFGHALHLFERDCSLQRRHQKVIEEAPAPGMSGALRRQMGEAAVAAAKAVGYVGAGTVEFIVDSRHGLRADGFYFLEMNTRLQVEHPVTEMITGLDLVELQLRVAAGEPLALRQDEITANGTALEARLYAEDPNNRFLPSTGRIFRLVLPQGEGVRVDSGVVEGDEVSPYYDPMLAKIIVHAPTRAAALDKLAAALDETVVLGPQSNIAFLAALSRAEEFRGGRFDTHFIDRNATALIDKNLDTEAIGIGLSHLLARRLEPAAMDWHDPFSLADAFQFVAPRVTRLRLVIDHAPLAAEIVGGAADGSIDLAIPALGFAARFNPAAAQARGERPGALLVHDVLDGVLVFRRGRQTRITLFDPLRDAELSMDESDGAVRAPMHGRLVQILVVPGQHVERGQRLMVLEAMKMEHTLVAPIAGIVAELSGSAGTQVEPGTRLALVRAESQSEPAGL